MSVPDPEAILHAAHSYARRGWRVLPLHAPVSNDSGIICSCILMHPNRTSCNSVGKHPIDARWQNTPPMSGADIQATFEDGIRNVGIATGTPSGFWVLDVDLDKPGTEQRLRDLIAGHDEIPQTYAVKTGGGGWQFYFAMPPFEVTNSAKRLPDGIDVRGTGGQVVAPPSVSGKGPYSVIRDVPIVRAPAWLEDLIRPAEPAPSVDLSTVPKITDLPESEQRRLQAYTDRVVQAELGRLRECREKGWNGPGWNQTTFEVGCALVELANSPWCPLTLEEARLILADHAPRDAGFGEAQILTCFNSAVSTVDGKGRAMPENRQPDITVIPGDPLTDPNASRLGPTVGADGPADEPAIVLRDRTDLGNARRLVDLFGHRLRYIPEQGQWAVYTDGAWRVESAAGLTAAHEMVETLIEREGHLYDDTPGGDDGDEPSERDKFFKWAKAQQMSARIDAAVKQATGRPEFKASLTDFDADPYLFNCANGHVDLRTGELTPHDPSALAMLQSTVRFDITAKAPRWEAFLERCMPDPEMRRYLQKATGYSLSGSTGEQAMFIHHGPGANGKSVYLVVASLLAGSYAQVVPRETLLAKGNNTEHPTSVARMRGRRFLQASETAAGRRLDEETVKGLTGGEQQTARFIGKDGFDFTPTGKIHLVTNHLPRLTDAESIWRRLHLIGWTQTIPVPERDPRLLQSSYWVETGEAEGILAWAVQGAMLWHEEGLSIPVSMKRDLAEYRTDQDILGEFLSSRLEADDTGFTSNHDIYAAYQNWGFNNGIRNLMTQPDLTRTLRERGYKVHRTPRARGFRVNLLAVMVSVDDNPYDPLVRR